MVVLSATELAGKHRTAGKVRGGALQARRYPQHRRIANKGLNPTQKPRAELRAIISRLCQRGFWSG